MMKKLCILGVLITGLLPALSYVDELCSYSTNEIAINWNAPLVFLAGAISYTAGQLQNTK